MMSEIPANSESAPQKLKEYFESYMRILESEPEWEVYSPLLLKLNEGVQLSFLIYLANFLRTRMVESYMRDGSGDVKLKMAKHELTPAQLALKLGCHLDDPLMRSQTILQFCTELIGDRDFTTRLVADLRDITFPSRLSTKDLPEKTLRAKLARPESWQELADLLLDCLMELQMQNRWTIPHLISLYRNLERRPRSLLPALRGLPELKSFSEWLNLFQQEMLDAAGSNTVLLGGEYLDLAKTLPSLPTNKTSRIFRHRDIIKGPET